jgi:ubiquinone/menaquinone biosynthesis C-methylase UbiE
MLSAAPHLDRVGLYDQLAHDYDKLHRRWLRHAGGEAQAALEAAVRVLAHTNTKLLDAGCGTGAFARTLIAEGMSPDRITLLDPSEAMLACCTDIAARQIKGRLEAIPFEDGEFDIVTCAWALETVPSPEVALTELCRIVRQGGVLCTVFCADTPADTLTDWLMRQALLRRDTGRFLCKRFVVNTIESRCGFEVRLLPCSGPVAALIARRI